jgi:hypothetical protein
MNNAAPFIFMIFPLLIVAVVIFFLVLWVRMLIHAASEPIENKVAWILILLFAGWVGAIIYYYVVFKKFIPKVTSNTPPKDANTNHQ